MAQKDKVEEFPQEGTPEYDAWLEQARQEDQAFKDGVKAGTEVAKVRTVAMATANKPAVEVETTALKEMTLDQLSAMFGVTTADEAIGTDQYGPILEDKGKLVGVPLVLVHWEFYPGDAGEFASLWVMTQNEDRYIVNDGGSGIYAQLRSLTDTKGINGMVACKHGLRVSTYDKELPNGNVLKDCQTYYIDTKL